MSEPWWTPYVVLVLLLSGAVWVGGLIAIAVVARAARQVLPADLSVAFFRDLGRRYSTVANPALALALITGAILVVHRRASEEGAHELSGPMVVAMAVASGALVLAVIVGIRQARAMTRLRATALDRAAPELSDRVRSGARRAAVLRGVIGLLTLAVVALTAFLLT